MAHPGHAFVKSSIPSLLANYMRERCPVHAVVHAAVDAHVDHLQPDQRARRRRSIERYSKQVWIRCIHRHCAARRRL